MLLFTQVFLEKRSFHEVNSITRCWVFGLVIRLLQLERNALVSVALRLLEYHRGVLFLTTNRITAFDDAFLSRFSIGMY